MTTSTDTRTPTLSAYARRVVNMYDTAQSHDAFYALWRAHANTAEALAPLMAQGAAVGILTTADAAAIQAADVAARDRLDRLDRQRKENAAPDFSDDAGDWLSEALSGKEDASDITDEGGRYEESVMECARQRAEDACIYTHRAIQILERYESEFGSDAEDLCSEKEYSAANYQDAQVYFANAVAVAACESYARDALEKLREELADLPERLADLRFTEGDDETGEECGEVGERDINVTSSDNSPTMVEDEAQPEKGVSFYKLREDGFTWLAVVELDCGLFASVQGVYNPPANSFADPFKAKG